MTTTHFSTEIPLTMAGYRLDKALAELFPDYSRARLQQWIKQGQVLVDDEKMRGKDKVQGGEQIEIQAEIPQAVTWQAQDIPLDICYEDEDILIINKPAGLVVHPGAGNQDGTLVNALLNHAPELDRIPRAGIIHRLDKDTSGILVVARSIAAHTHLTEQLQAREFLREYQTIVNGTMISGGMVDAPIGRHPTLRTRMAVTDSGKPAITHYRVKNRFRAHTHLNVKLETGRTHQIRVHLAYIRYPLVGDPVYGKRLILPKQSSESFTQVLKDFNRQALHAATLGLQHPTKNEWMQWSVPIPADMQQLLDELKRDLEQFPS
ncbi:23S rRNA pseudouridine(1911/1915/1917) synthase RluD [Candidatus Albibeggiatoa sp. nov. NOAA]|uniref:23S rRNA pseudouridine(1911/1915/1917) synthase RluD n=1 Tax=Candidatus Albibeggiatoa sp. nov. NOAA TaxID=3162724 RepID=UPI0032F648AE|nr:23S rRNA pseudouridine(1911/1915/1917) synthase RluD [Thiotrichaceae bacterium]